MTHAARWLSVALLGCVAGCAWVRPEAPPLPPAVPVAVDDPLLGELLGGWELLVRGRTGLRGSAALKLEGPGGSQRLSQNVVLERPARLRMEFESFLVTAAVLVAHDGRYDYFQSHDRYRERGPVHPGLLWEIAGVPLTLDQAVHFLLGAPPPRPGLAVQAAARLGDGTVRVDLADARGRRVRQLEYDASGLLRGAREWAPTGEVRWEVGYDRYRDVGEEPFAHTIDLRFPRRDTRARLAFRSVELNPLVPEGTFELRLEGEESAALRDLALRDLGIGEGSVAR